MWRKQLWLKRLRRQLICRRERWVLTAPGWGCLLCLVVVIVGVLLPQVYPFFAVVQPIRADALVVEGWVDDANIEDAAQEFRAQPYQYLLTTGGQLARGGYLSEYNTYADIAAASLLRIGIDSDRLISIPAPKVQRDRTYTSALALRSWLDQHPGKIHRLNLMSTGAHARRSWIVFKKALGPSVKIGIIAMPERDYDANTWWASSSGAKTVILETISYIYATLFNIVE